MSGACGLYLISPIAIDDLEGFARTLRAVLEAAGVAAFQLRLKPASDEAVAEAARRLAPIAAAHEAAFILNDRPDLAAKLGCDGVHIGQQDGPVAAARREVGTGRVVGVSCHASAHLAMEAAEAGADYVAFGAFFPSTTKAAAARPDLELLTAWQETTQIPCVAIGGITPENCRPLIAAGADFIAVSAGVWGHASGPAAAARAFAEAIDEAQARGGRLASPGGLH